MYSSYKDNKYLSQGTYKHMHTEIIMIIYRIAQNSGVGKLW